MTAPRSLQTFRFIVPPADKARRLDQVLASHIPDLSRRKARLLIDIGGVFVDGARTKVAGRTLRPGQEIVANIGGALERASSEVSKAARARDDAAVPSFRVVHEDEDMVVVEKPSGLLTAPTPESDRQNLARALSDKLGEVFVVHRLDLETSGLLVFARTAEANRALSALFREHDVERVYIAVLEGALEGGDRTVDLPLAGRRAVTHLSVVERFPSATVVHCKLETGRTHQIRLHAQHLGHPVMGDSRYGDGIRGELAPPRMALHAMTLGVRHPRSGEVVRFECPVPEDLRTWIDALRSSGQA